MPDESEDLLDKASEILDGHCGRLVDIDMLEALKLVIEEVRANRISDARDDPDSLLGIDRLKKLSELASSLGLDASPSQRHPGKIEITNPNETGKFYANTVAIAEAFLVGYSASQS